MLRLRFPLNYFLSCKSAGERFACLGIRSARGLVLAALSVAMPAHAAAVATTTILGISSSSGPVTSVAAGTILTLTATVKAGGIAATPGLVTFCDATASGCADAAVYGTVPLIHSGPAAGTATLRMAFGAGSHSVKAILGSTHNYQSSTSSTVTFSVTDIPTTTALQTAGTYSLRATVVGNAKSTVGPTGTITIADLTKGNTSLGSTSLGPSTAGQSFVQGTSMTFPINIEDIATGDFNGDGRQDLAFAMDTNNSILIALGNGDGSFQPLVHYIVYGQAVSIAVGDFNQDGALDLAVSLTSQRRVDILFGNGDGTFFVGAAASTGADPYAVATADFNEDGILDLAVANDVDRTYSILLGNGDGNFTPEAAVPSGVAPSFARIADFNGDGHLDIFDTNGFFGYTVLLGNGDGTFTSRSFLPPTGTYTQYGASALGDFNGDGIPDVVIEDLDDYLILLQGNGDGTFTQQSSTIPVGGGPRGMTSADLNRDGKLDLILADGTWGGLGESAIQLFYGNGDGTFSQATVPDVPSFVAIPAVADFNGDGFPDIFVGNAGQLATPPMITGDIFVHQFSQTATASLSNVCIPGTETHQVQANYPGDDNYQSSSSGPIPLTGSPVATSVTLTSTSASIVYGAPETLTAAVSATTGIPTGTVTFLDGGIPIGSAALDGTGHASLTTAAIPVGSHGITASYGGACPWVAGTSTLLTVQVTKAALSISVANASRSYGTANPIFTGTISGLIGQDTVTVTYATAATTSSPTGAYPITATIGGSDAATYAVTVTPGTLTINKTASTLTLTAGPNPALAQSSVSLTAQATSSTAGVPTGTVTFSDGDTVLGTAPLNAAGQAGYSTSNLSVGTHSITAVYGGDQNFIASTASPVAETIGDCTLKITGSSSQTVSAGDTATYTFAVTPTTPTTLAPVALAVAGLPASATFVFSPATVATGSGTTAVTLTVVAPAQTGAMRRTSDPHAGSFMMAVGLLVLPWGALWSTGKSRNRKTLFGLYAMTAGALLCLSQLSGCGGGSHPTTPTPSAQSYNLTVTASSGSSQHSATVALTVQ
jgi:Bacterial Ig-like domain (group 3)/MBG domain (YGX type)/FG-GAP-like repeat